MIILQSCSKFKNEQRITTVLITPMIQDVGNISLNEIVWKKFKISNTGNHDLNISNIDIGCTCISSRLDSRKLIQPGEFVNFSFAYNAKITGKFQKFVILDLNISEGHKVLTLRGNVLAPKGLE